MRIAALVVFLGVFAQVSLAQDPVSPAQEKPTAQQEARGTGLISGRVVNSASGAPVKSVTVMLLSVVTQQNANPVQRGSRTDQDGSFAFQNLPAGQYQLTAMRGGFAGYRRTPGTSVTLTDGQAATDILLKLEPTAVIAGRVVDEDGQPMQQVQVQAMRWIMDSGRSRLMTMGAGMTDDRGEYRVFNLGPGRYYVKAQSMFSAGMFGEEQQGPKTRYGGEYFPDSANVQNAQAIVLTPGEEGHADFQLSPEPVTTVRGHVTGLTPSPDITAQVVLSTGRGGGESTAVAPDGKFEMMNVLPGTYRVMVIGPLAPTDNASIRQRGLSTGPLLQQTVVVPDEGLSNLELHVGSTTQGTIRGQISADTAGADLRRLIVRLQPTETTPDLDMYYQGTEFQQVQADGTFTLNAPAAGSYYLSVNSNGSGFEDWYTKTLTYNGRDVTEDPIQLDESARGTLQLVVSSKGGVVEGVVTDSRDKPMRQVQVMTVPASGKGRPELFQQTMTDDNGRYSFRGVPPGDYRIVALTEADADAMADPAYSKTITNRGTSIRVDSGSHQTVALRVTMDASPQ